jgi:hypothetical protein
MLITPSPQYRGALGGGQVGQLMGQAGFADAWLPRQHHHLPTAGQSAVQGSSQGSQLLLAADESGARCLAGPAHLKGEWRPTG